MALTKYDENKIFSVKNEEYDEIKLNLETILEYKLKDIGHSLRENPDEIQIIRIDPSLRRDKLYFALYVGRKINNVNCYEACNYAPITISIIKELLDEAGYNYKLCFKEGCDYGATNALYIVPYILIARNGIEIDVDQFIKIKNINERYSFYYYKEPVDFLKGEAKNSYEKNCEKYNNTNYTSNNAIDW